MTNPYEAPRSELDGEFEGVGASDEDVAPLYVIGIPKLIALHILSFGFFGTYWFWRQWRDLARFKRQRLLAWARALFSVVFVVQLFNGIDRAGRDVGKRVKWSPANQALVFLSFALVGLLLGHADGLLGIAVKILVTIASVFPLIAAQRAANTAAGDPEGKSNSSFTLTNGLWLAAVWLFWIGLVAYGYFFVNTLDRAFPAPPE